MPTKARIPLPSVLDPTEFGCVQFNIPTDPQWRGMFWGALHQLTVWSSYDRSGDTSGVDVASIWRQIVLDARDSSCVGIRPNWYLDLEMNAGRYDIDVWNSPIFYTGVGGVAKAEYVLIGWWDELLNLDATISGRSVDDGSYVGGTVEDWFISSDTDPAGKAFTFDYVDCLGNLIADADFTPKHYADDMQGGQIVAGSPTVYFAHITISGDYTCIQA